MSLRVCATTRPKHRSTALRPSPSTASTRSWGKRTKCGSSNGFVNGQNSSALSGNITYGGNSQGAVNVGAYTIIPSGQTSSNYAITYVNGTLTITPPPIAFVLDALGTAANAAGTVAPSMVMNATVLPSPTSLPG